MNPGPYDPSVRRGDSWYLPLTLPSLVQFGGPPDLTNAEINSQFRTDSDVLLATCLVEIVDPVARTVVLRLSEAQTTAIPPLLKRSAWDLEVRDETLVPPFVGTVLAGTAAIYKDSSRPSDG